MYSQMDASPADEAAEEPFDFWGGIKESFASIPDNLAGLAGAFLDPLGISVGDVSSIEAAAESQEVNTGVFGSMSRLFDGKIGAFAYLLFILLYFPCVAAIAAVYRETNLKWSFFIGAWTTGLAYTAAVLFYQLGTISRHPVSSLSWIGIMIGIFAAVVFVMRHLGQGERKAKPEILGAARA